MLSDKLDEIRHHGVKGMKWGRRRYQNKDGSLTPEGVKRYARAGYAEDAYKRNTTATGKAYDKFSGAHRIAGNARYDTSSQKKNEARAEKYVADKKVRSEITKQKARKAAVKGAEKTLKVLNKTGEMYLTDQIFFDGMGTRATKAAVKNAGRLTISAYAYARGGRDIRWYDN